MIRVRARRRRAVRTGVPRHAHRRHARSSLDCGRHVRCRSCGGGRRKAFGPDERRGSHARPAGRGCSGAADRVPQSALGRRLPHAPSAARLGRPGSRAPLRVALRTVVALSSRERLARGPRSLTGRRASARPRIAPGRPGAPPVRTGRLRVRRARPPQTCERGGRRRLRRPHPRQRRSRPSLGERRGGAAGPEVPGARLPGGVHLLRARPPGAAAASRASPRRSGLGHAASGPARHGRSRRPGRRGSRCSWRLSGLLPRARPCSRRGAARFPSNRGTPCACSPSSMRPERLQPRVPLPPCRTAAAPKLAPAVRDGCSPGASRRPSRARLRRRRIPRPPTPQ